MRWSSAVSSAARLDDAIVETAARVRRELGDVAPDLAFVFVSVHHQTRYEDVPALVGAALEPRSLLGCSAGAVIGGGHEIEDAPGVSLTAARLDGVTVTPIRTTAPTAGRASAADERALVLCPEPFSFDTEAFLRAHDVQPGGVPLIGGLASGARQPGGNALFLDDAVHRDGLVGVALAGDVTVDTIVAQGCRPIGDPMFVTRADGNLLHEVDGRSPTAVLSRLHQHSSEDDRALFRHSLFLGLVMREQESYRHGDFLIRNVLGIDRQSGGLAVGALLRPGMVVQFHLRDARTSAEDLDALLARSSAAPAGALLFSCLGRGKHLFGRADHDTDAARRRFGDLPLGGFFCNGEIGPVQGKPFLHGYTSAFGLFRPGR